MENMIEITDFTAPGLDVYARLSEAELSHFYEPNGGLFIAESPMIVERALDAGCEPVSLLAEHRLLDALPESIEKRCGSIPVFTADFAVLSQLTGFPLTRGLLCAMRRPLPQNAENICRTARRIAVLENVMNPTNVGAIFRSAAALGMDAVLLSAGCSDPLYRRCVRVSMGTVFQLPWAVLNPEISCTDFLHGQGYKTAAMALSDDSVSVSDPRFKQENKLAVLLGSEGYGLKESTIESSDYIVRIPMRNGVDSLNVAAASAVVFWELGK